MYKNITKIFSSHIIVKVLGLLNIFIVLKVFSTESFGQYSYLLLLLHLVAIIIDPFLSAYLVDFKTFGYKKYNFGILFLSILLSPLFYGTLKFVKPDITVQLFSLFTSTFLISASLKSYLNVNERYFAYGLIDVLRQLSIFCSTIFFFYILKNTDYVSLLSLNYQVSFVVMTLLFVFLIKQNEIRFDIGYKALKKLVFNSKFFILYTAMIPFVTIIDSFFVEKYLTEQDLGLYSFSLKVYNISLMLVVPIFAVLNIKQIEIAKEKKYWQFFKKNSKKVTVFSFTLFVGAVLLNWGITQYLFLAYQDSFINTNILLCAAFITYLSMPFSFLLAYRKYEWLLLLAVIAISVNIGVNYFFIAKYGTWIAAVSTLLTQVIINLGAAVLSYLLLHKREK